MGLGETSAHIHLTSKRYLKGVTVSNTPSSAVNLELKLKEIILVSRLRVLEYDINPRYTFVRCSWLYLHRISVESYYFPGVSRYRFPLVLSKVILHELRRKNC